MSSPQRTQEDKAASSSASSHQEEDKVESEFKIPPPPPVALPSKTRASRKEEAPVDPMYAKVPSEVMPPGGNVNVPKRRKTGGKATLKSTKSSAPPKTTEKKVDGQAKPATGQQQSQQQPSPALVAQRVVHMIPVENGDGTISYVFVSMENGTDTPAVFLEQGDAAQTVMRVDKVLPDKNEGNPNPPRNPHDVEAIFLDKPVDDLHEIVNAFATAGANNTNVG